MKTQAIRFLLAFSFIFTLGCEEGVINTFENNRTFVNRLTIPGLCDDGQKLNPNLQVVCVETAEFNANGSTSIATAEAVNTGSYFITEDRIMAFYTGPEITGDIEFLISINGSTLLDSVDGESWFLLE
jgi:hypothetical protein